MITFKNAFFTIKFKNLFDEKVMLPLTYSIFYISTHSLDFKNCDFIMSTSTQGKIHFLIYFLNSKSFGHETWTGKILNDLGDSVLNSRPFLIYQTTEINQKPIMMSLQFWSFKSVL